jgi:hypothetical protein
MRTLAKRLWREAENRAEIHLANVSIWRKRMRIDNEGILTDPWSFLNGWLRKK